MEDLREEVEDNTVALLEGLFLEFLKLLLLEPGTDRAPLAAALLVSFRWGFEGWPSSKEALVLHWLWEFLPRERDLRD